MKSRIMAERRIKKIGGTHIGGVKARETNYARHGRDYFSRIGALGGRAGNTGGFYGHPERAVKAGGKGGTHSRKGYKFLGENEDGDLLYQRYDNGEELVVSKEEAENLNKKILRWLQSHPEELTHLHSDIELSKKMDKDFATSLPTIQIRLGRLRRSGQIKRDQEPGKPRRYNYRVEGE